MENSKTSTEVSDDNSNSRRSTQTETDNHISDAPYAEGEKVLANHGECLYEAKVTEAEYNGESWKFLVHYHGWKKSWDEWVGMDRLVKRTEENMRKKKALDEKFGNDKNARVPRGSMPKSKSNNNVSRGRKRKQESGRKVKPAVHPDSLVNIQIPPTLKKQLVDDCEFITHLGKLVKLPRTPNVNDIMKNYHDYRSKKYDSMGDPAEEIMKGLCRYFDKALPVILLYKNERQQYEEGCPAHVSPSAIYGAEHLLRLFVKLPELLFHASIEEETLTELLAHLHDFLRFLQKKQSTFFLSTYHVAENIENSTNQQGN